MSELNAGMDMIEAAFSKLGYPEGFLSDYDQIECLSEHKGRATFLVMSRNDGSMAVAKCYDREVYDLPEHGPEITENMDAPGLPHFLSRYANEKWLCIVREYIDGVSLSEYVRDNELSQDKIVGICIRLCDILDYLHSCPEPVIHRDIKPENVIIGDDGTLSLIDFDIARTFKTGSDSDTVFFGTKGYAPPEQYGFAQTDARTDIYSLGVLLRFLLTGSTRPNRNIRLYRPLEKIIAKCTAFAPEKRYSDVRAVRRALLKANPKSQFLRGCGIVLFVAAACVIAVFAGRKIYRVLTYSPFDGNSIAAVMNDEDRIAEAVSYMSDKYGTHLFDESDDFATVGLLRTVMTDIYGLDKDYVYAFEPDGPPGESDDYFMPWGWDDTQTLMRDIALYASVKVHDASIVSDWSGLKDDTGEYPGVRVARQFAEKTGILTGANQPYDITVGEFALILANTEKVFASAEGK